ncbi:hypothetical protein NA57DRAFT_72929 [Rhizodiscina lignyota]|uniref:NAD(P)-binding domain-containing protein n=1 Tax=Rhizodiscina lignyota TaxID=1504668 RepID=A0A9P4II36_9PEZI|nr:hypothetical protein NA57DRAFT_72929 [Rhizodiscina lignyota]
MSSQQTITFFGATGGCAGASLALCLKSNHHCVALVRTPDKLRKLLESKHDVPATILDSYLTVIQGNIKSEEDVKKTLTVTDALPDIILFGIGASPKLQMSLKAPATLDDPHVCAEGMKTVISALKDLQSQNIKLGPSGKKPLITTISTTGVSKIRDVPYSIYPVYHWLLSVPHIDKREMENVLVAAARESNSPISSFTIVRPTLLSDGAMKGLEKVKAGWVYPDDDDREGALTEAGPKMGYQISRGDVGTWIFERIIKGNGEWNGKCASLTY